MSVFKIAAIQMRSGTDPAQNAVAMEQAVRDAAATGAIYIQTPEMTGLLQRNRRKLAESLPIGGRNEIAERARRLSSELAIWLHVGSTAVALESGKFANRAFLFGPAGTLFMTYDKIHMFDVDLDNGESWRESAVYEPGSTAYLAHTPIARFGFSICYDLRFPALYTGLANAGAQVLCVPSAFTQQTGEAHWHALLRTRAIENGAYVIAAAQGGTHDDGRQTYGHSLVVDPWGRILAEADHDRPEIVMAEIDTDQVTVARRRIPNLSHRRHFELEIMETSIPDEVRAT